MDLSWCSSHSSSTSGTGTQKRSRKRGKRMYEKRSKQISLLYTFWRRTKCVKSMDYCTIILTTILTYWFILRMHKWAIPLAVVIGLGLAIPAGALSSVQQSSSGVQTCSLWNGFGSNDNHKVAVSLVFVTFFLPLVLLAFPFTLLAMQFFKCRLVSIRIILGFL